MEVLSNHRFATMKANGDRRAVGSVRSSNIRRLTTRPFFERGLPVSLRPKVVRLDVFLTSASVARIPCRNAHSSPKSAQRARAQEDLWHEDS